MKVNFVIISLLTSFFMFDIGKIFGQSPIWVVGNQFIENDGFNAPQFLPTGPASIDYQGQQAQYAANAWHNPMDGTLMFFIVDGIVYDRDGYYLGSLDEYDLLVINNKMRGISEISIVPDPGNCLRYYIIGSRRDVTGSNPGIPANNPSIPIQELNSELFYAVVNFGLTRENSDLYGSDRTCRYGALELLDDGFNEAYILSLRSLIPNNQKYNSNTEWSGLDFVAVTPKNANGEHYIFYQDRFCVLYSFKLNAQGITFVNNSGIDTKTGAAPNYTLPLQYLDHPSRSELEVIPMTNGSYGVVGTSYQAIQYAGPNGTITEAAPTMYRMNYNANGNPVSGSFLQHQHHVIGALNGVAYIKGIEFSPDQRFIYYTSLNNSALTRSIYCLDANTFTPLILPAMPDASTLAFKNSMIERAGNGALYISHPSGAFELINANNPATATLSANAILPVSITMSGMNYGSNPWWQDRLGLYLLPDQLDYSTLDQYNFVCGDGSADESCYCHYTTYEEKECDNSFVNGVYTVTANATWSPGVNNNPFQSANGVVHFYDNLVIAPGVTLTLNNMTLKFDVDAKLVVSRGAGNASQGARLNVNGTTLTAIDICMDCYMWPGIEAQGYNNILQTAVAQARVNISNNSLVEFAHFGVMSGMISASNTMTTPFNSGALVTCANSTFKDNKHDAMFMPYANNNASSFSNCSFITTNNFKLPNAQYFRVALWNNRGIAFVGCRFENMSAVVNETDFRGVGIASINSNFIVISSLFSPSVPCLFKNMDYGIYTNAFNSGLNYFVLGARFENNIGGVFSRGEVRPILRGNNFFVKNTQNFATPIETYGVYMEGCNRYIIEQNYFTPFQPLTANVSVFGCVIDNSGPFPNTVGFGNHFEALHSGGVTRNVNARLDKKREGLKWLCNEFTNNRENDLWVQTGGTINEIQGNILLGIFPNPATYGSAGNIFNTLNPPQSHFQMDSPIQNVTYMHHYNGEPLMYSNNISLQLTNETVVCGYDVDFPAFTDNDLLDMRAAFEIQKNELNYLSDYGDSNTVILQIMGNYLTPEQRRDLLRQQNSTFSDEVLIRYIQTNPSNQHLYEVLLYNSPLTDKVIHYMMEYSTLPSGMKQQILLIQNGMSEYEIRMQIAQKYDMNMNLIENTIIEKHMLDSLNVNDMQSIIAMYESSPRKDFTDQEILFGLYVDVNDFTKADSINTILKTINTDSEYAFLNDLSLLSLSDDLFEQLLSDSTLVQQLELLTEHENEVYAIRAKAILSGYLGYFFPYVPFAGDRSGRIPKYTYDGTPIEIITIFPNPTTDNFFIVFDENADVSLQREARIYDLAGNLQFTRSFDDNAYVLEINSENMTQGMYIVVISANGVDVGTYKVAVR